MGKVSGFLALSVETQNISFLLTNNKLSHSSLKQHPLGTPGWLSGLAPPPLAQGLVLEIESLVRLPAWSLLLPLPVSLHLS